MKKVIGLVLLLIVLVAVSGCTQQTKTAPATTVAPTAAPTEQPTPVATAVETAAPTPAGTPVAVATPGETTAEPVASVTAESTTVPAATATTAVSLTPSTTITVIHIVNNTFSPSPLMILPGTRISWVNDDKTVHSVKASGDHKGKFNSGDIAPTTRWGYDFGETEGTFEYVDGYNANATGVVIVKKGDSLVGKIVASTPYVTSSATW